jgi:rhodanese-related sulfurtransferase
VKLLNVALILLASFALAGYSSLALAVRERKDTDLPSKDKVAGIPLIPLAEAEALWKDPSTIFLDVRSEADYEFGHIPGALSVPDEQFEQRFPALKTRLQQARTIVVYCKSQDCGKSLWTALRLQNEGLTQARIYPYGWNEWYNRDLPIARGSR